MDLGDEAAALSGETFDALVVGAGVGGALTALRLAQAGWRVLVLEAGVSASASGSSSLNGSVHGRRTALGIWPDPILLGSEDRARERYVTFGYGPGGSSALYAAALERMRRSDFEDPYEAGGFKSGWPIPFDEVRPFYKKVERLFDVHGTRDPLDEDDDSELDCPEQLDAADAELAHVFQTKGLHPYRIHLAIKHLPGCDECVNRRCDRACKVDASSAALGPALARHGAQILEGCYVERLWIEEGAVVGVECRLNGTEMRRIRGANVVLAAGALNTPILLQKSSSPESPSGVGNDAGLVGRGLMFHLSDFYAFFLASAGGSAPPRKALALRDFYGPSGEGLGLLQSAGGAVSTNVVTDYLRNLAETRLGWRGNGIKVLTRAAALLGAPVFRRARLFATIVEDAPMPGNRVVYDPRCVSGIRVEYERPAALQAKVERFRRAVRTRLACLHPTLLTAGEGLNFAHASGTCRMGTDPATSVTDPQGRIHGCENVVVADASNFPRSGAVNPSLTIAANALRIAELMIGRREAATRQLPAAVSSGTTKAGDLPRAHRQGAGCAMGGDQR